MRSIFLFVLLLLLQDVHGQQWSDETLRAANTAADVSYLTREEKDMIFYVNLARTDGWLFFNTYFQKYVEQNNINMQQYSNYDELKIEKNTTYYRSLASDLKKIKGLPLLYPDERLSALARSHANDLNRNNMMSHNSSNGKSFADRVSKIYPNRSVAENMAFGTTTGLDIVCALLLDQNVPGLGHRINILNTAYKFTHIGVAMAPHPFYRVCSVMDFVSLPRL